MGIGLLRSQRFSPVIATLFARPLESAYRDALAGYGAWRTRHGTMPGLSSPIVRCRNCARPIPLWTGYRRSPASPGKRETAALACAPSVRSSNGSGRLRRFAQHVACWQGRRHSRTAHERHIRSYQRRSVAEPGEIARSPRVVRYQHDLIGAPRASPMSMQNGRGEEELHVAIETSAPLDNERLHAALKERSRSIPQAAYPRALHAFPAAQSHGEDRAPSRSRPGHCEPLAGVEPTDAPLTRSARLKVRIRIARPDGATPWNSGAILQASHKHRRTFCELP
jgi:hypothetical protein